MTHRHAWSWQVPRTGEAICWEGVGRPPINCGCAHPVPDPSSPCGFRMEGMAPCGEHDIASIHWSRMAAVSLDYFHHPHVATRCLSCGHAIEVLVQ